MVFYSNKMASFPACYFALISKESIVLLKQRISIHMVKNNVFFLVWCKSRGSFSPPKPTFHIQNLSFFLISP